MSLREATINILNRYAPLPTRVFWSPRSVTLWLTTKCNLNCFFCLRSIMKLENIDMKKKTWKKVLEYNLKELNLCGNGETLLHPDFFNIIREAKKRDMRINFSTNGILIDENMISKFRNLDINNFSISIDGVGDLYKKIRETPFDKIYNTVVKLSEFADIGINYVGMKMNALEFSKLVKIFNNYASLIRFNHIQPFSKKIDKQHLHRYPKLMNKINKDAEKSNSKNIKLRLRDSVPKPEFCIEPFFSPYIAIDGSVYPCCILGDHHDLKVTEWYMGVPMEINPDNVGLMGNIHDKDLKEIFNSKKFINLRKIFLKSFKESRKKKWTVDKYVKFREKHADDHPCVACAYRFSCVC